MFKLLNTYWNTLFVQSIVSFMLQNGFSKWRNKGNYQKWQEEMDR